MKEKIYGLLGGKLSHSYSPEIHAALGAYPYRLFETEEADVPAFLASDCFEAINVTIPYKKTVMPYLASISEEARKIGSVNTIIRTPAGLHGDNTDYYGFSYMLDRSHIDVCGRKCLVLGSGGASATAVAVLRDRGGFPVVISRTGENNYNNVSRHADASVIVNTTPVGMYPHSGVSPISLDLFPHLTGVIDVIYNPRRTALIQDAEARGIPSVSGLSMLVAQAKRANELFFNRPLPEKVLESVIVRLSREKENIILIGMPGSGKTVAGRALAEQTGRVFIDTDEEIAAATGRTPAHILATDGEASFRNIEHRILCEAGQKSGAVIATGGGVVTISENYAPLHQNGIIVYLTRPLEELATDARPLSAQNGVETLFKQRRMLYESWADVTVACQKNPTDTAQAICAAIGEKEEPV